MKLTATDLAQMLGEMSAAVRTGDSLEGRISYQPGPGKERLTYEVEGAFRTGNLDGQGGTTMIEPEVIPLPTALIERLDFYLALISEFHTRWAEALTTVSVDGFDPWTCLRLGEVGGLLSRLGHELTECTAEAAARPEAATQPPSAFMVALEAALESENPVTLRLRTPDGRKTSEAGVVIEISPPVVVLKLRPSGALMLPLAEIIGVTDYTPEGV